VSEPAPTWNGEGTREYRVALPEHVAARVDEYAAEIAGGDGAAFIARIVIRDLDPVLAAQMESRL
jgi:hypothetical protein